MSSLTKFILPKYRYVLAFILTLTVFSSMGAYYYYTYEIYAGLYLKEFVIIIFTVLVLVILTGGPIWFYHYRQKNIYRNLFDNEKELRKHHKEFKRIYTASAMA